ncbi:MAG: hypothetical protein IPK85_13400 [Gemmatimonadetes bacterium]|nr:hypothetical protein [Gemmatimonadota bacterium]
MRDGAFLVTSPYRPTLQVFTAGARFGRVVGKEGSGPDESRQVAIALVGPGDTVHTFDDALRRYRVVDPSGKTVRSHPIQFGPRFEGVMTQNFFVLNAPVYTADLIGLPLQVLDRRGRLVRSTGSSTGLFRPDVRNIDQRALARARGDTIWSAHRGEYRVDLIDAASGKSVRSYVRDVEWFRPSQTGQRSAGAAPEPYAILTDVREDANGYLWVMVGVPDPAWRAVSQERSPGDTHGSVGDDNAFRDTVIEVFDLRSARLIAMARSPRFLYQFVEPDLAVSIVPDAEGFRRMELVRLQLKQP